MRLRYLTGITEGRRRYGTLTNEESAEDFISKKIAILREEGMDEKQAVAVAYKYAKEKGYKVPAENSTCPICKDDMDMHDDEGRCDKCGNRCG